MEINVTNIKDMMSDMENLISDIDEHIADIKNTLEENEATRAKIMQSYSELERALVILN